VGASDRANPRLEDLDPVPNQLTARETERRMEDFCRILLDGEKPGPACRLLSGLKASSRQDAIVGWWTVLVVLELQIWAML
jgi:hypothetical protein